jgi:hypothetical protein
VVWCGVMSEGRDESMLLDCGSRRWFIMRFIVKLKNKIVLNEILGIQDVLHVNFLKYEVVQYP